MLNVGGVPDGMDPEMPHQKSAFMELSNQGMGGPGMGHPAYPVRSPYQPHHHAGQYDGMTSQPSRGLPYHFPMNTMSMSPSSYNHGAPTHPFSMPPYHQSASPPRDGSYLSRKYYYYHFYFPYFSFSLLNSLCVSPRLASPAYCSFVDRED